MNIQHHMIVLTFAPAHENVDTFAYAQMSFSNAHMHADSSSGTSYLSLSNI